MVYSAQHLASQSRLRPNQSHVDPPIASETGRDPHLQVIPRDRQRAVLERQRSMHGPDLRIEERAGEGRADPAHACTALLDDDSGSASAKFRRRSARPVRIRKDVQVRQGRALQVRGELLEVVVRLPGEAGR
jgi:hypothetical protein